MDDMVYIVWDKLILSRFRSRTKPYPRRCVGEEQAAVDIANSGNLNPNWFGHPATFLIYILAAFYKFVNLFSIKGTPFDQYLLNPEPFFLFGRILSRFAAATSVILTYKLANKFLNKKWALSLQFLQLQIHYL